jgi:site-specific recombinase XerD
VSLFAFGVESNRRRRDVVSLFRKSVTQAKGNPVIAKTAGPLQGQPSPNRGKRFPVEVLSADEVRQLIGACSRRAPTGLRNKALIGVLYYGQLRIAEALGLKEKDLDPDRGTATVLKGKGGKRRVVALGDVAWGFLHAWLERRRALGIGGRCRIFSTLKGGRLQTSYVRALLPRLARKCGIDKRVHPHGLRHSGASALVDMGADLRIVQRQLGHSSLSTTDRYVNHLNPKAAVEAVRSLPWERLGSGDVDG